MNEELKAHLERLLESGEIEGNMMVKVVVGGDVKQQASVSELTAQG